MSEKHISKIVRTLFRAKKPSGMSKKSFVDPLTMPPKTINDLPLTYKLTTNPAKN